MISGKLISLKDVVWRVYRDSGIQDEIPFSDVCEWAVDALELIYHPDNFQRKVTGYKNDESFDVTNYRLKVPCDLVHVVAVSVDGFPALPSTNTYHQLMEGSCCGVDEFASILSNGTYVDGFGNTFITNLGTVYTGVPLTYELNNDWITLSVKEGKVCLAYLAHPTDECGLPMFPDNISYKEAITKCILMRLDYLKWRQSPSDQGLRNLYEHSEREYNFYLAQAQNAAKSPDINKMESIKNMLLRSVPKINHWASNFAHLSKSEIKKLH